MWCAVWVFGRYLAVNTGVRSFTADSGAVRSVRVPNPKIPDRHQRFPSHFGTARDASTLLFEEPWLQRVGTLHAPADHGRLDGAARFMIAPCPIDKAAGERQLIGAAMVLAQHLDRQIRRRFSIAIEFSQTSFARCHFFDSP